MIASTSLSECRICRSTSGITTFLLYDRHFSSLRGRPIEFLEIGVAQGANLQLWRKYLGAEARIFCIDVVPEFAKFNGLSRQVRIGSQDDPIFLPETVREMEGIDLVPDDGSHRMEHIQASLNVLFPLLSDTSFMLSRICTPPILKKSEVAFIPEIFF